MLYKAEYEKLRRYQRIAEKAGIDNEELKAEFEEITRDYEKLLKEVKKITRISDRYHNKIIQANEEISRQREELEQSNETKDRLFSLIAHDLRGSLGVSMQMSELLVTDYDEMSEEEILHFLNDLGASSAQTYNLLENLLQWARDQRGDISYEPEPVGLSQMVERTFHLLMTGARQKHTQLKNVVDTDLTVLADKNMLDAILRNLLTNAMKYTGHGIISVEAEESNGMVEVTVKDTGVGMTEEQLNDLLTGEKTISSRGTAGERGTGMGMKICRDFLARHNSELTGTSEPGVGTTLRFRLPAAEA